MNVTVAIPRFGEEVAPCFEYSATISVYTVEDGTVVDRKDFSLRSTVSFDRVRLLRDQSVDVLICGGLQDVMENMVTANNIKSISWVSGSVDTLLDAFIKGKLKSGMSFSK